MTLSSEMLNIFLYFVCLSPVVILLLPHMKKKTVRVILVVSLLSFAITYSSIPTISERLLSSRSQLFGYDLCKGKMGLGKKIPESLGIVSGSIYIVSVCSILFIIFEFLENNKGVRSILIDLCAGLFSSMFMLFLGFADNVLDLRWRYKLVLPSLAVLPMVVCYNGSTKILIPVPFRIRLGMTHLEIGGLYKLYIGLVAVYCSNTINILAGINGLETGQSFIICLSVIVHNLIELDGPYKHHHLFSLICMFPFLATTSGLMYFNWYPSEVFVGDSFTYFAGMTFAVVGILGHFSKTLMLLFIPQWFNFFYSLPQLFHLVPIPRHRVPIYDPTTGYIADSGNWTLINLVLRLCGPMHERSLTLTLCGIQVVCNTLGLLVRYLFISWYYPPEEFANMEDDELDENIEKEKKLN